MLDSEQRLKVPIQSRRTRKLMCAAVYASPHRSPHISDMSQLSPHRSSHNPKFTYATYRNEVHIVYFKYQYATFIVCTMQIVKFTNTSVSSQSFLYTGKSSYKGRFLSFILALSRRGEELDYRSLVLRISKSREEAEGAASREEAEGP